jgi:hypothetical protein
VRRQHRRASASFEHIRELRHACKLAPDPRQLLDRLRRLDEQAVCAGFEINLGAPQGIVEAVHGAGVGTRDDEELRAAARIRRCAHLRRHGVSLDHILARHVAAAFGRALILHEDRRHAHRLVAGDGARDILDIAVAIVAVDQHRQAARRHDVADAGAHLAEAHEPDVGQRMARADEGIASDRISDKARALDEAR